MVNECSSLRYFFPFSNLLVCIRAALDGCQVVIDWWQTTFEPLHESKNTRMLIFLIFLLLCRFLRLFSFSNIFKRHSQKLFRNQPCTIRRQVLETTHQCRRDNTHSICHVLVLFADPACVGLGVRVVVRGHARGAHGRSAVGKCGGGVVAGQTAGGNTPPAAWALVPLAMRETASVVPGVDTQVDRSRAHRGRTLARGQIQGVGLTKDMHGCWAHFWRE